MRQQPHHLLPRSTYMADKKKITIERGNRQLIVITRPVIEYRMTMVKKGLSEQKLNSMPFYFASEEDIKRYLNDCGEKFTIEDAEDWE
jgi:hypothetical protein